MFDLAFYLIISICLGLDGAICTCMELLGYALSYCEMDGAIGRFVSISFFVLSVGRFDLAF